MFLFVSASFVCTSHFLPSSRTSYYAGSQNSPLTYFSSYFLLFHRKNTSSPFFPAWSFHREYGYYMIYTTAVGNSTVGRVKSYYCSCVLDKMLDDITNTIRQIICNIQSTISFYTLSYREVIFPDLPKLKNISRRIKTRRGSVTFRVIVH